MGNEKSCNDLPLELIREILMKLPVKSLLRLRCVCKTWLYLISDPNFAKSHLELAAAPTRRYLFIQGLKALSYDLDALFRGGAINFSMPCKNPFTVHVLGSCRGFILLDECPNLIIWNPSTGTHKRISYSHVLSDSNLRGLKLLGNVLLYGFGYDESKDDYLVVLAWRDNNKEDHWDFFSVRNNSWNNFEVALPNGLIYERRCRLFLNGAFHWLGGPHHRADPLLLFDLKERIFLKIPLPEQVVVCGPSRLMEVKGCLAFSFWNNECKPSIWVKKDCKLQSSWNFYGILHAGFIPVSSSHDGDITGYDAYTRGFSKYNVSRQKLEGWSCQLYLLDGYAMYTESLLSLPNYSEGKKKGCRVRLECFEQLDAVTNNNHNEVKERKRIRSAPSWTRDFYCN